LGADVLLQICMSRTSLKARLFAHLRRSPGIWICGAEMERFVIAETDYSGSNATRRLRELHEEKPERVEREYRKGKHGETLAWYRYVPSVYERYAHGQNTTYSGQKMASPINTDVPSTKAHRTHSGVGPA
jgi:hypothetical protein